MVVETTYLIFILDGLNNYVGVITEEVKRCDWSMLKISFVEEELIALQKKIRFTPLQKRIMQYRIEEIERVKMADLEKMSVQTIDREIKKIADKIKKVIW